MIRARALAATLLLLVGLARADETASPMPPAGTGGDPPAAHAAAVALYEGQSFDAAEDAFRAWIGAHGPHPVALLGLGNAAYRRGEWATAVYAYEWGLRLKPGDPSLAHNVALARSHLVSDVFPSAESDSARAARVAVARVPGRLTLLGGLVAWLLGWLLLAARQRGWLEGWTWLGVALILVALPAFAHAAWQGRRLAGRPEGVLQTSDVTVRSGPGDAYPVLYELHAGTVVGVGDERSSWRRIRLPSGVEGWVEAGDVAVFGRIETLRHR